MAHGAPRLDEHMGPPGIVRVGPEPGRLGHRRAGQGQVALRRWRHRPQHVAPGRESQRRAPGRRADREVRRSEMAGAEPEQATTELPVVEGGASVVRDGAQRAGDAGQAHALADLERPGGAELARTGERVDEVAGQGQHDGGGEALVRQLDGRAPGPRRAAGGHGARAAPASRPRRRAPARSGRPRAGASPSSPRRACRAGSDPAPARPTERSASGGVPGGATMARTSPPRPHRWGPTTAIAAPVATAASAAEPPRASRPRPAEAASWSAAATMPRNPVRGPKGASGRLMRQAYHGSLAAHRIRDGAAGVSLPQDALDPSMQGDG